MKVKLYGGPHDGKQILFFSDYFDQHFLIKYQLKKIVFVSLYAAVFFNDKPFVQMKHIGTVTYRHYVVSCKEKNLPIKI